MDMRPQRRLARRRRTLRAVRSISYVGWWNLRAGRIVSAPYVNTLRQTLARREVLSDVQGEGRSLKA